MLNYTISNLGSSTVIATGFLCREIGETSKSQLPRFIDCLIGNGSRFPFAAIYALRSCFIAGGKTVQEYGIKAFEFVNEILPKASKPTVALGLRFMKVLLNCRQVPKEAILELARACLTRDGGILFIKEGVALLVARCAYEPFATWLSRQKERHFRMDSRCQKQLPIV